MSKMELHQIDSEDIEDIIVQLQESLGTTFPNDAFKDVDTFGELVTAVENNLTVEHAANCTSQQAFYRIRKALKEMNIDQKIMPSLRLNTIFPKKNRRAIVNEFSSHLKIDIKLLQPHGRVLNPTLTCLFFGVILLFIYPLIGFLTIACSILALRLVSRYGSMLRVNDVRELSELLRNEKYSLTRSTPTINRKEIQDILVSYLEPYELAELTSDSKFEWAK